MKTTAEAAEALGIKPDKLTRILTKFPDYRPSETFAGRLVWTDKDIESAKHIVAYVEEDVCPGCGWTPGANADEGPGEQTDE